jgi:hypothetical protein
MADTFQRRAYKILDRIVGFELDKAFADYRNSSRTGNSHQRAFDRLGRLINSLNDWGRIGRRVARANGLPSDDEWEDRLPGGKADGKTPSDFEKKDLQEGAEVELEHTDDYDVAIEIASDHLEELGNSYYPELKKMEKKLKDKKADDVPMGTQTIGDNPLMSPLNEELSPTDKSLNALPMRPRKQANEVKDRVWEIAKRENMLVSIFTVASEYKMDPREVAELVNYEISDSESFLFDKGKRGLMVR